MKSDVGKVIDLMCYNEKVGTQALADRMGYSKANLNSIKGGDARFSSILNIAIELGYDIVFTKSNGMGSVRVSDGTECDRCAYKMFSDNIEDALNKLSAAKGGTELDFYKDDTPNKETKIK